MDYTINCHGRLVDMSHPMVMGILNITPDSFYAESRKQTEREIVERAFQIIHEGGEIIDVGACSTRPGGGLVSQEEEQERLRRGLTIIRRELPDTLLSIDTFRPEVARMAIEEYGADIINDVGDDHCEESVPSMFDVVALTRTSYIYMSRAANIHDLLMDFSLRVQQLRDRGQKDIILDPGFGFGKTLEENFNVLSEMEKLQVMELPLLVGISRKRMVWQSLHITPDEALNGTTVMHTIALQKGASILRVHDVKAAVETVRLLGMMKKDRT